MIRILVEKSEKSPLVVEEVRIEITKCNGERYINIKIWQDATDNKSAKYLELEKEFVSNKESFDELKSSILKADKEIEKHFSEYSDDYFTFPA